MARSRDNAPTRRRSLRRAVQLDCEVHSDLWEGGAPHLATNLSDEGVWLRSQLPLEVGEELIISLTPPRWPGAEPLLALAAVARVGMYRRRGDSFFAGMGLCFIDLEDAESQMLGASLKGLPPPLPIAAPRLRPPLPMAARDQVILELEDGSRATWVAEGPLLTGGRVHRASRTGVVVPLKSRRRTARYLAPERRCTPAARPKLHLVS